jgi:uncharacterized protein (TIGR01777 family)
MTILITGASGFLGTALTALLKSKGHEVRRMGRSSGDVKWNPEAGSIEAAKMEGFDAVVHLAGENIAGKRWSEEQKRKIRDSRVKGTRLLAETLAGLQRPPKVLVSASAIGFYGNRGDEALTEDSKPGTDFLSNVCKEWEEAAEPAARKGIRVVFIRTGIVLSKDGGAIAKMLMPFKMGVGGKIGDGRQYMSWIALSDECRVILHAIETESIKGPVNSVAPNPVRNAEFTKAMGAALHRPTIFPMPAFAARIALGEMADALLLSSAKVLPKRLMQSGFKFDHTDIHETLKSIL